MAGVGVRQWAEYLASGIKRPKSKEAKPPDQWNGAELDGFLANMVEHCLGLSRPDSTPKSRNQAKHLLDSVGGDRAIELIVFVCEHWTQIQDRFHLDSPVPSCGIMLGFLEPLKGMMSGNGSGQQTGTRRMDGVDWSKVKTGSWE